jgi:hypothetical protein
MWGCNDSHFSSTSHIAAFNESVTYKLFIFVEKHLLDFVNGTRNISVVKMGTFLLRMDILRAILNFTNINYTFKHLTYSNVQ